MQKVSSNVFNLAIRIQKNTGNGRSDQWAKIIDAKSGKTLHIGQLGYIKRVARKRYNVDAAL